MSLLRARRVLAAAVIAAAASVLWARAGLAHETHRPHRAAVAVTERAEIAAAHAAQARHDFGAAQALLDRRLADAPGDLEARLMRANLHLLAGEFAAARRDCGAALEAGALYAGTVCLAAAQTGPGSVERGRRMIAALGTRDEEADVEFLRWRLLTEADLASRAGEERTSLYLLERAYALDPGHEEARTQLAERVLAAGDAGRALELALAPVPAPSPARLVLRLRAALALGDARAAGWRRELEEALASDRRRGIPPHWREEGELALYAGGGAAAPARASASASASSSASSSALAVALALARRNFETQKDTRDLRLLAAAAVAAVAAGESDPSALAEVRRWLEDSGFEDLVVQSMLSKGDAPLHIRKGDAPLHNSAKHTLN